MAKVGKLIIKDKGWNKILKNTKKLDGVKIKVGLFGNGQPDENLAYRGAIQEYGIPEGITVTDKMRAFLHTIGIHLSPDTTKIYIPARPFMRQAWIANRNKINFMIADLYKELPQKSLQWLFDQVGKAHKKQIQDTIANGDFQKNSEATLQNKTGSTPLINTGEMKDGVKYEIEG